MCGRSHVCALHFFLPTFQLITSPLQLIVRVYVRVALELDVAILEHRWSCWINIITMANRLALHHLHMDVEIPVFCQPNIIKADSGNIQV
jgi:hypothetical protein